MASAKGHPRNNGTWICISAPHLGLLPGDEPAHAEVLLHRHAREQAAVLRHPHDAEFDDAVGRRGDEVDGFHLHAAAYRADQSGDDAHQDVLPAPLGPITGTASPAISRPCKRIEPAVGANVSDNMSDRI